MKTIGYVLLLLAVIVVARIVGGSAAHISAEGHASNTSKNMVQFLDEMQRFQLDSANRATAANNAYMNDLKASGFFSLFDAIRIQGDTGLANSFEIVNEANAALERYKSQVLGSMEASKEQIGSLNISDEEKKVMLSSFVSGSSHNDEILTLEGWAQTEAGKIILLLASNKSWSVESDAVVFNDDGLQTEVTSHFQKFAEISHRQQEIREEIFANAGIKSSPLTAKGAPGAR